MGYTSNHITNERKSPADGDLRSLLDEAASRYNVPAFVETDPVQFPRRYTDLRDIEIAALLSATIAWGNRRMICRDCNRLLGFMNDEPHHYVLEGDFESLPDRSNIHRTFFTENLKHFLRGLRRIYREHYSLQDFAVARKVFQSEFPSWALAEELNKTLAEENFGKQDSRCLPQNLDSSALKRINMAFRWLVRRDGIVDIGCWDAIRPSQLYIPLDVHSARSARHIGLLSRASNDRKAAVELTKALREFRPEDPTLYDFALFGLSEAKIIPKED